MTFLLQRNLFKEAGRVFALTAASLLTLLIISRAVQMRETLLGLDIGIWDTICLFGYMTPFFLLIVIPVACMLSIFLTFLRVGTDRELVALKAGGVSVLQMLPAPVLFAVLCFAMTLCCSLHLISWGMDHFRAELVDIATNRARIEIQPGVFNHDFPNLTIYARQTDTADGTLKDVVVNDESQKDRRLALLAPQGSIMADHKEGAVKFTLNNGRLYTTSSSGTTVMGYKTYTVSLPLDRMVKGVAIRSPRPQELPYAELFTQLHKLRDDVTSLHNAGRHAEAEQLAPVANRMELQIHKRWTYPVACLILGLFVIPFAVGAQGMHKQTGMVLTLLMFFVYYTLMSCASVFAEAGILPITLVMWTPNILFLIAAIWGIRMTYLERSPDLTRITACAAALLKSTANRLGLAKKHAGGDA